VLLACSEMTVALNVLNKNLFPVQFRVGVKKNLFCAPDVFFFSIHNCLLVCCVSRELNRPPAFTVIHLKRGQTNNCLQLDDVMSVGLLALVAQTSFYVWTSSVSILFYSVLFPNSSLWEAPLGGVTMSVPLCCFLKANESPTE